MLNNVVLMGRLVADPELKTTATGVSVSTFRIAVDRRFQKSGETRQADFITIVAWRQQAEFVCRYFKKGSMIAITGSIQTRTYETANGEKRTAFEVVADNVSFCGSKAESGTYSSAPVDVGAPTAYNTASATDFEDIPEDDEDLPF